MTDAKREPMPNPHGTSGARERRTVHKYVVRVDDTVQVYVPAGSVLLLIAHQPERMRVDEVGFWYQVPADVSDDACLNPETFFIVGTGNPVPANTDHIVSIQAGAYVWHVYTAALRLAQRGSK